MDRRSIIKLLAAGSLPAAYWENSMSKEVYNIHGEQSVFINFIPFILCTAIFQVVGMIFIGIILGAVISFALLYYQKQNNPGIIKHYLNYIQTPDHFSGNKYQNK